MSHIFDALLKSENDRNGKPGAASANLTEILRLAEQRAAAERKSRNGTRPAAVEHHASPVVHEPAPASDFRVATADFSGLAPQPTTAVVDAVEEPYSVFDHFRSIPAMLPAGNRLVAHNEKESPAAEAFRLMAVRLHHIRKDRTLQKVLITSSVPEEGKSMVSANLACTLAAANPNKVLLLEADVRRPSLTQLFQLSHNTGLCEYLSGSSSLEKAIYRLDGLGFWILPSGRPAGNPLELIQSPRLSLALDDLQAWFDWIIVDTPPVLPLADTSVVSKLVDGILMVTRRGVTEKKQMLRGIDALDKNKLLGAVINSSRKSHHDYYYYGYGATARADAPSSLTRL